MSRKDQEPLKRQGDRTRRRRGNSGLPMIRTLRSSAAGRLGKWKRYSLARTVEKRLPSQADYPAVGHQRSQSTTTFSRACISTQSVPRPDENAPHATRRFPGRRSSKCGLRYYGVGAGTGFGGAGCLADGAGIRTGGETARALGLPEGTGGA